MVLDVLSGDTLWVRIKDVGTRRVKLAGVCAPADKEPLAAVSRFHLLRMAKGLRTFIVMTGPVGDWPDQVTATVEDFAEAQLGAGMGHLVEAELSQLGAYTACRCRKAESQAQAARAGLWGH